MVTWLTDLDEGLAAARERGVSVYALLTVDWCPWCRRLEEETLLSPPVAAVLERLVTVRLDGDENEDIVGAYDFQLYPTALIFNADGEFVELIEGFLEKTDDYLAALEAIVGSNPK
jgi:thiol:disulfide interchange protein